MIIRRLKETHPFMQKVLNLYNTMEELGISIEYGGAGALTISDTETGDVFALKDEGTSETLSNFPTGTEFKLTFKEDEY